MSTQERLVLNKLSCAHEIHWAVYAARRRGQLKTWVQHCTSYAKVEHRVSWGPARQQGIGRLVMAATLCHARCMTATTWVRRRCQHARMHTVHQAP